VGKSAAPSQGNVREFQVPGEWSSCTERRANSLRHVLEMLRAKKLSAPNKPERWTGSVTNTRQNPASALAAAVTGLQRNSKQSDERFTARGWQCMWTMQGLERAVAN